MSSLLRIARFTRSLAPLYTAIIITSVLTPYMLNPTAWNWGNYTGFFWAGLCAFCIVYTYFRVPEPKGIIKPASTTFASELS